MNISEILTKSNFTNSVIKELYVKSSEVTDDTVKWFTEYVIERLCEEVEKLSKYKDQQNEIDILENKLSEAETEVDYLECRVYELSDKVNNLESNIDDLKMELEDASETISDLENDLASEKEENENLRMRLNE